jgi:hypothetical protein
MTFLGAVPEIFRGAFGMAFFIRPIRFVKEISWYSQPVPCPPRPGGAVGGATHLIQELPHS